MITSILQYFEESLIRSPDKTAVVCAEESLTYAELNDQAIQIGQTLQSKDDSSQMIPFVIPKSIKAIAAILGIMKAGRAYIPIDVNSPKQRLDSIVSASGTGTVLVVDETEAMVRDALKSASVCIINVEANLPFKSEPADFPKALSIDLAYVLFTSGSTGVPKGVMIPHKAVIDYIEWCVETYHINDLDQISNHAPLYFDNSTFDIYTAFKAGATLHLVPETLNAVIPRLVKWLKINAITVFFCVPSVMTMLLKSRRLKADSFPELRHVLAAGEVLPPQVLREWMLLYPHITFTNMYGPTEITVDCSFHTFSSAPEPSCTSVPIGKARQNMALYVRTEENRLLTTPGSRGELLVRGNSVGYGYLNDSEKTNAAFIQNPSHSLFPDYLYCTGDIVEIDENGDFHFIGRKDNQIKYLGYRIELGEIEARLLTLDLIHEAVVVFSSNPATNDPYIGALIKVDNEIKREALNDQLAAVLPGYMVPSIIRLSEGEMPRTPNGKYDRKVITGMVDEVAE